MMMTSPTATAASPNLHGLDFGDVGRFERVKGVDGSLQRWNRLGKVVLALLLDALRSCCSLVGHDLIARYHLHTTNAVNQQSADRNAPLYKWYITPRWTSCTR